MVWLILKLVKSLIKFKSLNKMTSYGAILCGDCGFSTKKHNCCKCDTWMGRGKTEAKLCGGCSLGAKKHSCVKCKRGIGVIKVPAHLCNICVIKGKKKICCFCGGILSEE